MSFGNKKINIKLDKKNTLTEGQKKFLKAFEKGKNIFLTGPGGCGKSYLIDFISEISQRNNLALAKTASTGVAAFNIGGQTIHSFCGIGLGDEDVNFLIKKVFQNRKASERIRKTDILVIDEVSMVKAELFEKVDLIFRAIKSKKHLPFGGIQVILVADFLQLPPIWKKDETKKHIFESKIWHECKLKNIYLTELVRQKEGSDFAEALLKIRVGDIKGLSILSSRIDAKFPDDGIEPVRIFCKNIDVNKYNEERLKEIKSPSKFFYCHDTGSPHHIDFFNKNCPALETVELKVGAQVMLLSNFDTNQGLVNGSIGVVKSFTTDGPIVGFKNTDLLVTENRWEIKEQVAGVSGTFNYRVVASRTQIPLKVCYSVTVHKSQGVTLDRASIDLNEAFGTGIVYVALSRVRNLESLSLADFPESKLVVDEKALEFYDKISGKNTLTGDDHYEDEDFIENESYLF